MKTPNTPSHKYATGTAFNNNNPPPEATSWQDLRADVWICAVQATIVNVAFFPQFTPFLSVRRSQRSSLSTTFPILRRRERTPCIIQEYDTSRIVFVNFFIVKCMGSAGFL